ncbi:MAG: DNA mismatch repair endonuclease MutL [Clostridia bacterium]
MKINLLDSSIYNKIAAGEVVENPSAVVKELVENSIDAGADQISVRIENGGIKSIEVSDNGSGIPKDELVNAILAHATSKISQAEDLNHISTLGFRGEALASISAVSELEIKSKYYKSETGAELISNASGTTVRDLAFNRGTSIAVNGLFYNTPARYKFLKTSKGEGGTITALMAKLILANPLVAFDYYSDEKLIYSSSGKGLWDAIIAIYTAEVTDFLIPIEDADNKIRISGYIGRGELYKSNRTLQTVILNGRVIFDQTISHTIQNAYGERMMQRQFPVFIINIVMPFDEVDINVHPNKKEVRFAYPREVYGSVYQAVKYTLDVYEQKITSQFSAGNTIRQDTAQELHKKTAAADFIQDDNDKKLENTNSKIEALINAASQTAQPKQNAEGAQAIDISEYLALIEMQQANNKNARVAESTTILGAAEIINERKKTPQQVDTSSQGITEPQNIQANSKNSAFARYKIIGQLFSTYLIVEIEDRFLIIDQHAAHERILYDKLVEQVEIGEAHVQPMLFPYIYEGTPSEIALIEEIIPELEEIGFEIESFGSNSIKINATPLILTDINLSSFMADINEQYGRKKVSISGLIKPKLMQSACKAAIKGGDSLSEEQIAFIIDYFFNNSIPLKCPHGRPAYISYTKLEIEKLFRRKL